MESLHVFSSNRVERLYEALKVALYHPSSGPFAHRLIVVPSPAMKNWLLLRLANDPFCKIAAGIEICYLDQALESLRGNTTNSNIIVPNEMELSFLIEGLLCSTLSQWSTFDEQNKFLWEPLHTYFVSNSSESRLITLSHRLAKVFLQYGRYAGKMLRDWETTPVPNSWQGALWKEIKKFCPALHFDYQLLPSISNEEVDSFAKTQLHLFAISFISASVYEFFTQAAAHFPIYYYLLSPCQVFWSDIASDKEKIKIERYWRKKGIAKPQLQALDFFLRKRNSLLANFGRMGREIAQQIERYQYQIEECYQLPAAIQRIPNYSEDLLPDMHTDMPSEEFSLLHAVHSDMLLLRNPEETEKIDFPSQDQSIQLHVSFTKLREIEALYHTLLHLLTKDAQHESPLTPADVIVMIPNLSLYEPFISSVFGAESSLLDYQMVEGPFLGRSSIVQGFLHLLSLACSRWEAERVLQLLEYSEFRLKQGFSNAQVQQIRMWTIQSGVTWGQNIAHRIEQLDKDYGSCELVDQNEAGTWDYGLSRLLTTLAIESAGLDAKEHFFSPPIEEMESSHTSLLVKWITLIKSLQEDLRFLFSQNGMSLNEWNSYFKTLLEKYFQQDSYSKESVENYYALSLHFENLKDAAELSKEMLFSFSSVYFHIKKSLSEKLSSYRESHLHAVRFCSLLPMRALPAKVVALIGMNEGVFPRNEIPFSLNEMPSYADSDYCPSQTDFDRYLFLEALLSARRYFILSYVGYSFEEQREMLPSLLVQEFFGYLDTAYQLAGKSPSEHCIHKHPFDAFDKAYFDGTFPFPSYSNTHYRLAKVHCGNDKIQKHRFVKNFTLKSRQAISLEEYISINELGAFAKNPLKSYFNKALRIYLNKKDSNVVINQEPFDLSALNKYQIRMDALKWPVEGVLKKSEREGVLPRGLFKSISSHMVKSEVENMFQSFAENDVKPHEIVSLHFSHHCEAPFFDKKKGWIVPPLSLEQKDSTSIKILGSLKGISPQGLIFHQARDLKGIIGVWPQYLVLCLAIEHYNLPLKPQLISSKSIKPFIYPAKDIPQDFQKFLNYYSFGLSAPSPLIPDWIPFFLKGDPNQFAKSLQQSLEDPYSPLYNEYAKWVFRDSFSAEEIYKEWQPISIDLFGQLAQHLSDKKG